MLKVYVKWGFTDDYGRVWDEDCTTNWFETMEEAEDFIADKRVGNGGYFKVLKVAEGDYTAYLRIAELRKELAELEKLF
jgi:hypothetical protein